MCDGKFPTLPPEMPMKAIPKQSTDVKVDLIPCKPAETGYEQGQRIPKVTGMA
jgi:hypothetical protein